MDLRGYFAGLPAFLAHFGVALLLTAVFLAGYTRLTPHREWTLIRNGVPAAAVALVGSLLGFVLPLASAIAHSVDLLDCVLWGAIALLVQWLVFMALRLVLRDLPERISRNDLAAATLVAGLSLSVGALNAACMTW
jgi:putative membrane protein